MSDTGLVSAEMRGPRDILLAYAALVFGWQVIGIALRAMDLPALGPTASPAMAVLALAFGAGFLWTAQRLPIGLVALSLLAALGAGLTLVNTFKPDVDLSLWPSPLSRYAGAVINAVGVIGCVAAIRGYARGRSAKTHSA
ncbi:MAG: hypothetical protein AB8G23_18085 [Myxococcota bacterium]